MVLDRFSRRVRQTVDLIHLSHFILHPYDQSPSPRLPLPLQHGQTRRARVVPKTTRRAVDSTLARLWREEELYPGQEKV